MTVQFRPGPKNQLREVKKMFEDKTLVCNDC